MKPQARGRVYCLYAREEETKYRHAIVLGSLLFNHLSTRILLDAGATYSFIHPAIVNTLSCKLDEMDV